MGDHMIDPERAVSEIANPANLGPERVSRPQQGPENTQSASIRNRRNELRGRQWSHPALHDRHLDSQQITHSGS